MSASAAVTAFNLFCVGVTSTSSYQGERTEPYEMTLRVDLASARWCENACRAVWSIAEVHPGLIVFRDRISEIGRRVEIDRAEVDRATGRHFVVSSVTGSVAGPIRIQYEGVCERRPFTGFEGPPTQF